MPGVGMPHFLLIAASAGVLMLLLWCYAPEKVEYE
jgi:hypothetical protein